MPLRDFVCDTCHRLQERFYHRDYPSCACGGPLVIQPLASTYSKSSVFPMEGRHITPDGTPITITDIGHLRRVEREYGVVLTAFSNDPSRTGDPIHNPPSYRGAEMRRRA